MSQDFPCVGGDLRRNGLVKKAVKDRVGAGGGHPDQVEHRIPNHDVVRILRVRDVRHDAEYAEGQPTEQFRGFQ